MNSLAAEAGGAATWAGGRRGRRLLDTHLFGPGVEAGGYHLLLELGEFGRAGLAAVLDHILLGDFLSGREDISADNF